MRKLFLLMMFASFLGFQTFGQLTGTFTIPGAPYATIAAAITALNTQGVGSGGVTFNITAGYTETFASATAGYITTSTGTAANQIIFQKSGAGANPVITAPVGVGTLDAIICFNGASWITFNGINLAESAANLTGTTRMEWGFALLKASATQGSSNNTIKNCTITLNAANVGNTTGTYYSCGIYSNNHTTASITQLTVTAATGANSNNKIYANTITNVNGGIYFSGYADGTAPYTYYDQNNDIGSGSGNGNTITNFGSAASVASYGYAYGIYANYQNGMKIANSSITSGAGITTYIYGIYTVTANNANVDIYANTVTLTGAGTTAYLYGIYNGFGGSTPASNTVNIYNNTVTGCTYPTNTSGYFYGIYNAGSPATLNVYSNNVTNNVIPGYGSLYGFYLSTGTGTTASIYSNIVSGNQKTGGSSTSYLYGISIAGTGAISAHDNQIFSNTLTLPTYSGYVYGLYASNSAVSQVVYNNSIHDLTVNNSYTSGYSLYGIYSYPASTNPGLNAVYNNSVYNITYTCTSTAYCYMYGISSYYANNVYGNSIHDFTQSTTSSYGYCYALYCYYGMNCYGNSVYNMTESSTTGYGYGYGVYFYATGVGNIYNNKVYGINMSGSTSGGYYYGMYLSYATSMYVYNNYVSDIKAPASMSTTGPTGIYIGTPATAGVYYNTVYLNATSTSTTTFNTQALYASTTPVLDLRNNILINTSTAPGSTTYITAAYRRSANSIATHSSACNNNDYYAGTPSATNVIMYDGSNTYQTLAAFKTLVTPADGASITELPPFSNITTTPYDLHIKTTVPTQVESGGVTVSTPIAITTDYDAQPRYPNTGYPDNVLSPATAPDMGADEFGGLFLDISPPVINFTALMNTSSTSPRLLATTITDHSGVPTSGTGLPRLYWKKFATGTWNSVQATFISGSTYQFSFGSGVVLGDSVYYYVVAQDLVATPNVGSNPPTGSGYTANPPACSTPPSNSTCYAYKIVATICGSFNVGTGQTYTTLTAAINDLANKELSCAVTLRLTDATYGAETFPIVLPRLPGASATNTVTIKPATGVNATITGAATGPMFKILNSYTTLDGSNATGGATRNLTFTNTSTTTPQVLVVGSTGFNPIIGSTVKNCILINGANTSSAVMVSDGAAPGNPGYFNNITIQNNSFQQAYIALYCNAFAQTGNGSGMVITQNDMNTAGTNSIRLAGIYVQGVDGVAVTNNNIGNIVNTLDASNETGIWLATATVNATVSGNNILTMSGSTGGPRAIAISSGLAGANISVTGNTITDISTASSGMAVGIYFFSTTTGCTITNNMISNIKNSSTGGWLATGMYLASTAATSALCNVYNNAIWDVASYGYSSYAYNGYGMTIYSGFGYNVYFNTVYLNTEQTLATGMTSVLFVYSSMAANSIDLRNNIFCTAQTNGTNRYVIYCLSANTAFSNIDYNDYYTTGPNIGYMNGTNCLTLTDMQTYFGGNLNSQVFNPTFTGTDLHPTNASLNKKGLYLASVPTDITGAGRTNPTEMGIYQMSAYQAVTTNAATGVSFTVATLNGNINPNGLSVTSGFDWGLTTAYGNSVAGTPAVVTTTQNISASISGLAMSTTYHFRAKGTNGGATVYGSDMTFTTPGPPTVVTNPATMIGATFATLNGSATANNDNTTVSFEWGLTTAYGTPAAGTPSIVSGNTATNFTASLTGLTINTTYHYRAKGVNGGGTVYGTDQTFFTQCVIPPAPGSISGPPSVCQNTGGYTFSVTQVPYGFVYNWTFPAGFTITSYPYSNVVTVSLSGTAVSGTVSVYASSSCGANSPSSSMAVTVNPLPVPTVTGPSPVCQSANYNYSSQSGQTGYVWTAGDGIITPTADPSIVTIKWPTAGAKTVGVIFTNPATGCTAAAQGTLPVTVNAAPVPTISGLNSLCANSGYYDYQTETGKTSYVWTVSSGGTITGGQGTALCEITWNTAGAQFVTVNYNNAAGCSAPSATVFNVTVGGVPGAAGSITGSSAVCAGAMGVAYSVNPISNASSYVWSLPAGAIIASGSGTNSITVNFSASAVSGDITVYGNSLCGNGAVSSPFPVTISQLPVAAGAITGPGTVCEGASMVSYSVAPITNATGYTWSLPPGATISSGDNTPSILVDFANGAVSGNITVFGTNTCGTGNVSPSFPVVVKPIPGTPVITNHGDTLYSNTPTGNQWYYNGAPVQNANGQTFVAHYTGWYWDAVTMDGCESDTSNNIYIVVTGVTDPIAGSFTVYPVPNDGHFKLLMTTDKTGSCDISICNNIGVTVYTRKNIKMNGSSELLIDLRPVSSGVYTMIISSGENKVVRKIIVN